MTGGRRSRGGGVLKVTSHSLVLRGGPRQGAGEFQGGGGGHSDTEYIPTAKRLRRVEAMNAKI